MFIKTYIPLRHDIKYFGNDICKFFSKSSSSTMMEAFEKRG